MLERGKYLYEKCYPYIISLLICLILHRYGLINTEYREIKDALGAALTVATLIIGFVGAVLPIIMGIKSESKYVKEVIESDAKNLFAKYIRATVSSGLCLIGITVALYLERRSADTIDREIYIWVYIFTVFLLSTYRCISIILKLIFAKEIVDVQEFYTSNANKSVQEIALEEANSIEKSMIRKEDNR